MSDVTVLCEGIAHPEGPEPLADGRFVFVETVLGRISAWSPDRGVHVYADTRGGPNSTTLGLDGLYVTQTGGTAGPWRAADPIAASIQKVTPDGDVQDVTTSVDGRPLNAPNDLTFGPDGRLYFTDPGHYDDANPMDGFICVVEPDGTTSVLAEAGPSYPNGIIVEPDGSVLWNESYTRRVRRWRPDGTVEHVTTMPEGRIPDGMKYGEDGLIYMACGPCGNIEVITSEGELVRSVAAGDEPLNCAFDGTDLIVTDFGPEGQTEENNFIPTSGRLLRVAVGVGGRPLYRGQIASG